MTNIIPKVSIITPVFNGAEFIAAMIQSCLEQDVSDLEHIVIDDGSTDAGATVAILEQYDHLSWWTRENKGQYATMNEGLRAAKGEWVCFISADDILTPGAVKSVLAFAHDHPDCDVIYGKSIFICDDGSDYKVQNLIKRVPTRLFGYLPGIYHCSMYLKREQVLENGLCFNEDLRYTGDFDWITRVIRSKMKIGIVNKTLAAIRIHPTRASTLHKKKQDLEHKELLVKHGYHYGLFRFLSFLRYLRSVVIEVFHYVKKGELSALLRRGRRWFRRR